MGVDGNNSGNFTEVSNMIANLEQNKELFDSMNSRATFARHHRKQQQENNLSNSTEKAQNIHQKILERSQVRSSSGSWTIEEIPLNPRQSKNLMETLNETPLNITVSIEDEIVDETNMVRSESVKSNESVTIINELYNENAPPAESVSNSNTSTESDHKRTPIQNFKKSKFESFIPNSIKNMFLSTKRSQNSNSIYDEKEEKSNKRNPKIRKSPRNHQTEDTSTSSSSPVAIPNLETIDNETIVSNWISILESVEILQEFLNSNCKVVNQHHSTSTSQNNSVCITMNGRQFIDLIRMSYQNLFKSNLVSVDVKLMYAFVHSLIGMELVVQESQPVENPRLSLASNLCKQDETLSNNNLLFESLLLNFYPERIQHLKEKVFVGSLQFLSHQTQVTCQPTETNQQAQTISTTQTNKSTSQHTDDRNEQQLNTKNMLLQRTESKLLLSFEEFISVNNHLIKTTMGSSISHEDGDFTTTQVETNDEEENPTIINSSNGISEMSNDKSEKTLTPIIDESLQTTSADLSLSNSTATSTFISSLGTNVSNHIHKQPSNITTTTPPPTTTPNCTNNSTLTEESSITSPYEMKLKIGEKTLSELKQQLKERKHRYGFLTPTQFLEFGLRAGFDEEEFASIFAVTYSTLMSAHQLIPQMQHVMKTILNDEKLPKPITDDDDDDDDTNDRGSILEDDCKLSKEEKNNVVGRVARFLKQFVLLSFSDFQYDKQFHEILYSFVAPLIGFIDFEGSNGTLVQEQVVNLVERITLVISGAHEDQFCQTEVPPKPLIKKLPTDPRKINLVDIDPVEIARQLTLFEFSSFEKLSAKELLGASWMKDSKEWTAPNVTQLIWRSNQLTDWVSTFICSITNLKDRKKAMKHLIHVADACLEIHNYNTVFEIVMGLISQPVYRLKKTWEVLKENDLQRIWKRLEDITSFPGNRRVYRDQIQKVIKESVVKLTPCLPYLGVHLSDLVFFDEGNKDSMEKGVTTFYNCTKRACMGQIVYQIIAVKKIPYNFQKVDLIEQFIWWQFNSKVLHDEDQRDKLSKKCEQ